MADGDKVGLLEIRAQAYDAPTNTYVWHPWWVPDSWTVFDPQTDPGNYYTVNVAHFKIPNKNADFTWKIKGSVLDIGGRWKVKVRVGDTVQDYLEYPVYPDQNGDFELTLPALGPNNACWVWYSLYQHNPPNINGLVVHNCMRVRTMD